MTFDALAARFRPIPPAPIAPIPGAWVATGFAFSAPLKAAGGVSEGTAALPDGLRAELELLSERRLSGGVVHVHYRAR